jgi:hypothetical protein
MDAQQKVERWRAEYKQERPHSLGYLTPDDLQREEPLCLPE